MSSPAPMAQPPQLPGTTPREIRAALLPEERGGFDREYRQVMRDAMESLDLTGITEMLVRWHRVARMSMDPEAHRDMLDRARRYLAGEKPQTVPWSQIKAELGL